MFVGDAMTDKIDLKTARIMRHKTQQQMADFLRVSVPTYSNKESGKRQFSICDAEKICQFLNYALTDIDWGKSGGGNLRAN